ncbi:helix-turn-helix domain-containing protein [Streptomyces aureocirculatus]|uniref:helix-turn-helix domain-containing protein n=1 Tax=Streptomyces aureocirculatus TaxID=67275 RepID=UPI0004CBC465|nr:helix-turn-helix domain-containing protein [Streptomyces aureocirculatus]
MLTLGTLVGRAELELDFAAGVDAARYEAVGVATLTTLTLPQLLEGEPQRRLEPGSLVLITGLESRLRGRAEVALETLMEQLALDRCAGLVVHATPEAPRSLSASRGAYEPSRGAYEPSRSAHGLSRVAHDPSRAAHGLSRAVIDLSHTLAVPLLITSAAPPMWARTRHLLRDSRLAGAERHVTQLTTLVQQVPTELADPQAMQRIADWLARSLRVQVLVSDPQRVLAASPATAAETLAPAIIHRSMAESAYPVSPHTRLITLAPARGADTVLAVARSSAPFDDAELRLLGHAARLLGLLDQARREHRAAADASRAARRAAMELLLDGEVDKARRVMAPQAPGLLETDTARVFVVDVPRTHRDTAVRRCEAATAGRALVIADPRTDRRILLVQPVRAGRPTDGVGTELTRLIAALGIGSVGGSGVYSISLLAEALREATAAQGFALQQPDSVALSAHHTDLISLLPAREAQLWARQLLSPLMRNDAQWEQMRETLLMALAHPYTVAARRLNLHRNTVTRRVARAAEALHVDFAYVSDRIAVGLALELVTHREQPGGPVPSGELPPTLRSLLASPQVTAWADTLLLAARGDRRDLLTTATVWLTHDAHIEPTARALGLSEATVRSHLRALEQHLARDLGSLGGLRDLQFSLHVVTGEVEVGERCDALCPAAT